MLFEEWDGIIKSDYKRGRFPNLFRNGMVLLRQIIREEDFQSFSRNGMVLLRQIIREEDFQIFLRMGWYY